jgi:hypothetical protein
MLHEAEKCKENNDISEEVPISKTCSLIIDKNFIDKSYSPTCIKRSPLGQRKSYLMRQVTS